MMVEVFMTNIRSSEEANQLKAMLDERFPGLSVHVDIEHAEPEWPCRHNVLRVQGETIDREGIIGTVSALGFECGILEDKICSKP